MVGKLANTPPQHTHTHIPLDDSLNPTFKTYENKLIAILINKS